MVTNAEIKAKLQSKRDKTHNELQKIKENEARGYYQITGSGHVKIITMVENGIKTDKNQLILYKDIDHIEMKTNISRQLGVSAGLIGFAGGLTLKTVEINFLGGKLIIRDVNSENAALFVQFVQQKISKSKNNDYDNSLLNNIKKAKELHDMGAITEEEFNKIKERLLK